MTRQRAFAVVSAALLTAAAPVLGQGTIQPDSCPASPGLAVVHGDDQGVEVASEFLTGCDRDHATLSSARCHRDNLHAPGPGTNLHLDQPEPDLRVFFWDKHFTSGGKQGRDNDSKLGLETAAILFYFGHSQDLAPQAYREKKVPICRMSLGDECTRYLWMVSCNVMAHGPVGRVTGFDLDDYIVPEKFDPTDPNLEAAPSEEVPHPPRSVFWRWGRTCSETGASPLNPRLRMVCGGSSWVGGQEHPSTGIWRRLLIERLPPAESFLLGLLDPAYPATPLCLSRGSEEAWQSPLFDADFVADPNPHAEESADNTYLWIEYPVELTKVVPPKTEAAASRVRSWIDEIAAYRLRPWIKIEAEPEFSPRSLPPKLKLPVLTVQTDTPEWVLRSENARELTRKALGFESFVFAETDQPPLAGLIDPADVCVQSPAGSDAHVLTWRPREVPAVSLDLEKLGPADLLPILAPLGESEGGPVTSLYLEAAAMLGSASVREVALKLDRAPADKAALGPLGSEDIRHEEGCRFFLFRPLVEVKADPSPVPPVPLLGAEWLWGVCPPSRLKQDPLDPQQIEPQPADPCLRKTPALLTFSFVMRETAEAAPGPGEPQDLFTLAEAREMSRQLFQHGVSPEKYEEKEVHFRLGYKAAPPHCHQTKAYAVYQLDYRPKDSASDLAPLTVEVPAHKLCDVTNPAACLTRYAEDWSCPSTNGG
jgi:hypothetical protein